MVDEIIELKVSLRLHCFDVLTTICCLLATLLSLHSEKDETRFLSAEERNDEKVLTVLDSLPVHTIGYPLL